MEQEVGYVISNRDFLVYLDGLPGIMVSELVESETGLRGLVSSLNPDRAEALLLDEGPIYPGQLFKRTLNKLNIVVGDFLLGRVINPLGIALDGKKIFPRSTVENVKELDKTASGIQTRKFITDQFITGITLVDSLIPIGKGQRELILGDAHSGKTSFLVNLIINQKNTGIICIYASVGKPIAQVRDLIDTLGVNNALGHCIIVAASSSDPAPLIFLTPQTAFTVAEYFQTRGRDVLLILDDMGTHAKIYREIALLSGRAPGRESYPGDIFYQHAHLMERAGNFRPEVGGGSITALPVMELNFNDFTSLIPTNLIAMTDGHLLFKSSLHNQGQRPAIDVSLSVSRVGRQTQFRLHNLLSSKIRQLLAQAQEVETVSRFSSELPFGTQLLLYQREVIQEMLKQEGLNYIPLEIQIILLALPLTSFLAEKNIEFVRENKSYLIELFQTHPKLRTIGSSLGQIGSLEELVQKLEAATPLLNKLCIKV